MELARSPRQIGHVIRRARKRLGWSQTVLGVKAGLRQEAISQIENGRAVTKLGRILDVLAALDLEVRIAPRSKSTVLDLEDVF